MRKNPQVQKNTNMQELVTKKKIDKRRKGLALKIYENILSD